MTTDKLPQEPAATTGHDFQMVAKTFQGLEDVLCEELINLGARNVETGLRMVSFEGDLEIMYKANLCCRTALRILKPIFKLSASDPDELYDAVRDIEWEEYLTPDSTFAIDSTVNSSEFRNSRYVTYRVKDGIVDHFNDRYGRRPSIRLKGADVLLNVHIFEDRVTISLDSSGEPLSRRGYRADQTEAPLNEALAAGIILKTGWRGDTLLVDPMCGSGTFLIEAALIAANINPGIYRDSFAFEKWPDFDRELFEAIYNDDSAEKTPSHRILGGDIDPEAVAIARRNIDNARLGDYISIECKDFREWTENEEEGMIIMNPPYGERLRPDDIEDLYRAIGTTLKRSFSGWHAWILGYRDEHFEAIRLKPTVKIPVLNGALECSLREYVMFDGKYDAFRAEGGSVGKEAYAEKREKMKKNPAARHMSDREWREESRRFGSKDRKEKRDGFKRRDDRRDDRHDSFKRRDDRRDDRHDSFKRRDDRRDDRYDSFKRRDDRRDDRHDSFKRRDDRRDDRRDGFKRREDRHQAVTPADKAPRISADKSHDFGYVHMRKRKGWKPADDQTED